MAAIICVRGRKPEGKPGRLNNKVSNHFMELVQGEHYGANIEYG